MNPRTPRKADTLVRPEKMTPAIERLVRLMVLLPDHDHPLW
jgi:hypothetical protein